jgi:CDP-glucose 4,6-dehydratase
MGTVNILDALRGLDSVRVALMVTTDKVYRNLERHYPYREDDELGGYDPYSASKAACEIVISSYRNSFLKEQGIAVASARAGNVIGGGDWSEDRLIPDAVRVWEANEILKIRNPESIRPWQHVLEPLHGYMKLAEKLYYYPELAGPFNFGPNTHEAATVREVVILAKQAYGKGDVHFGDVNKNPHEASWLALETAKVRAMIDVKPKWSLIETVSRTMKWYQAFYLGADPIELCQIEITQMMEK